MGTYLTEQVEAVVATSYRQMRTDAPPDLGVCTAGCCLSVQMERDILGRAPRDITVLELQEWFSAAAQDPMPRQICQFLLPRVLDGLAQQQDMATVGVEVTLRRFAPLLQATPLAADFQRAYLDGFVPNGDETLDAILCMFCLGGVPVELLARQILTMDPAVVVNRLWRDWCAGGLPYIAKTAFWPKGQGADVLWLSPDLRAMIESVILSDDTPPDLVEKADAVWDVLAFYVPNA